MVIGLPNVIYQMTPSVLILKPVDRKPFCPVSSLYPTFPIKEINIWKYTEQYCALIYAINFMKE